MQIKLKNEVNLVKLELKSGGKGEKAKEKTVVIKGQALGTSILYYMKAKVSALMDFTQCASLLGDEFAVLAFSRNQDGEWMYDKLNPRGKFDPHSLTLYIDENLTYDPVRCGISIDSIEPNCADDIRLYLSLVLRVQDERILLHLARRLGKELKVFIEPAQLELELDDDDGESGPFTDDEDESFASQSAADDTAATGKLTVPGKKPKAKKKSITKTMKAAMDEVGA